MLDIGRLRTGRLQLNKEQMNLSEIAHAVFERFKSQIEEKCSKFDCGVEENIMVLADVDRVEQVIFNILTSAIKYGEYKLLSAKVFTDKVKGKVYIDIRNKEIENSEIEKKFQTDDRILSSNEESELGLGLSVAKEIIVAHGGEILIDSEVGVGPTFTVRLPLVQPH
jgi:signal transduction histidine kinase